MSLPISIIIPTYNEEKYLPKLLESIRKQTAQPAEIIVADAFSKDNTRLIAKAYGCRVVNGGKPAAGRNNGAKVATQEYLLFLDADVVFPKVDCLQKAFHEIKSRKLSAASCLVTPLSSARSDHLLHSAMNLYLKTTQKVYPHAPGFCIFAKKTIHQQINGFDESLVMGEDHNYVQKASKIGRFAFLKSLRIKVSVRRLKEDGRLTILFKYFTVEMHMLFIGGVRRDLFNYKFGDHQ